MMLRLRGLEWHGRPSTASREDQFVARYEQILRWALHLTANDRIDAEDLVQDAFVDFVRGEANPVEIQNLDAYLYTLLRNIHRSQLHRQIRRQQLHVPILDFDSAAMAFPGVSHSHWLQIRQELTQICEFACERRSASKTGSILILRFFLDYLPSEIVRITRLDPGNVERRLYLARREARAYVENSKHKTAPKIRPPHENDLFRDLQRQVFESPEGPCLSEERLDNLYSEAAKIGPDPKELAHLCSCRECLDRVNRILGLPCMSERTSSDGGDSDSSAPGGKHPNVVRWRRQLQRVREHRPRQLLLCINGVPLVWQPVTGECSAVTVRLNPADPVEWLEVFSDQDVRLLSLAIEHRSCEDKGKLVSLSDGRELSLLLRRETLGPTVRIKYRDPMHHFAKDEPISVPIVNPPCFRTVEPATLLKRWKRWLSPRILSPALAAVMVAVLLSLNVMEPRLSAAQALDGARRWGARRTGIGGDALHRTFDLIERKRPGAPIVRRRIEVWRRERNRKFVRLFDAHGTLVESAHWEPDAAPKITPENAWQFEPSPETFQILSPALADAQVRLERHSIELQSGDIRLTLDRQDFRPKAELLHVTGEEFEFHEAASSSTSPEFQSWPSVEPEAAARSSAGGLAPKREPVIAPDLSAIELRARQILHANGADLGEQIEIRRLNTGVEVSGVVDSGKRKKELAEALSRIPGLRVRLASPEDAPRGSQLHVGAPIESVVTPPLMDSWLKDNYPDESSRQAFVSKIFGLSGSCVRRAFALQQLTHRYPAFSDPTVGAIATDHIVELRRAFDELEKLTAPILGPSTQTLAAAETANWSDHVLRQTELLHRHLLNLLAHDASTGAAPYGGTLEEELAESQSIRQKLGASLAVLPNHF